MIAQKSDRVIALWRYQRSQAYDIVIWFSNDRGSCLSRQGSSNTRNTSTNGRRIDFNYTFFTWFNNNFQKDLMTL